jgi:hypothetical protein
MIGRRTQQDIANRCARRDADSLPDLALEQVIGRPRPARTVPTRDAHFPGGERPVQARQRADAAHARRQSRTERSRAASAWRPWWFGFSTKRPASRSQDVVPRPAIKIAGKGAPRVRRRSGAAGCCSRTTGSGRFSPEICNNLPARWSERRADLSSPATAGGRALVVPGRPRARAPRIRARPQSGS